MYVISLLSQKPQKLFIEIFNSARNKDDQKCENFNFCTESFMNMDLTIIQSEKNQC